ncbi:threonine synthase [soil metagenome]
MLRWRYTLDDREIGTFDDSLWKSPNNQPLGLEGPNDPSDIQRSSADLARYAALLPVEPDRFITLGAGMTPLINGQLAGREVFFKLDSLLPTGSFKDRGAAVAVAHLRSIDIRRIIVDSSGNAAASMSAYSAASGIDCVVYAPATASPGKLVQSEAYGSNVVLVDGSRDDVANAAQNAAESREDTSYVSHNWSPIFAEGVKTWAIEVWEQLGNQSPQRVFVPTGGGSALAGSYRGFLGADDMPQIIACQPAACDPVAAAFERDLEDVPAVTPGSTIAEGARISDPPRGSMLLHVLRESGGWASSIGESEIRSALRELWHQGIYAEPTAALGAAGFIQAARDGRDLNGSNVILITGTGLKATESIRDILAEAGH